MASTESGMLMMACEKVADFWWVYLMQGIATLILGVLLLAAPGITMTTLIVFLGIYWIMLGLISFVEIFVKSSTVHWGWLLFSGILGVLAGLIVLRHPIFTTVLFLSFIVLFLAIDGIIMGIMNVVRGFRGDGAGAVVLGLVSILIGFILLAEPLLIASVVPIVLGAFAAVGGLMGIVFSFRLRPHAKEAQSQHGVPAK